MAHEAKAEKAIPVVGVELDVHVVSLQGWAASDRVSQGKALKLRLEATVYTVDNQVCEHWTVHSRVTLASDPKLVLCELGELFEPQLKEQVVVSGGFVVVGVVVSTVVAVTEANTNRGLNVEHVCSVVPAVLVLDQISILSDCY